MPRALWEMAKRTGIGKNSRIKESMEESTGADANLRESCTSGINVTLRP